MATTTRSSRDKVRAHRARMKTKGMRLIQMRCPTRAPEALRRQAHRESLAIANSPHEADDQAFVDAVSVWKYE
jgi:hypothetical protein